VPGAVLSFIIEYPTVKYHKFLHEPLVLNHNASFCGKLSVKETALLWNEVNFLA